MRRPLLALLAVALVAWVGTSVAQAADSPDLRTIGIDAFPVFGQNQPSSIGDFRGQVGQALFSVDNGRGFVHFESDMRFMQGTAKNPLTGTSRSGSWGLT
jgi:hypothetical protein